MAVYVLDKVIQTGDRIDIAGSVDGVPVQIVVWFSHVKTLGGTPNIKAYIASQMQAALPPVPVELTQYEGTFVL